MTRETDRRLAVDSTPVAAAPRFRPVQRRAPIGLGTVLGLLVAAVLGLAFGLLGFAQLFGWWR